MYSSSDHTFVICAYRESPFLEACIKSIKNQSEKTALLMVTSTPNDYIRNMCKLHSIALIINTGPSGLAHDWNFGYSQAETDLVTIAHQDDIYEPKYAENIIRAINRERCPLLAHTGYYEIRNGDSVESNYLLFIKRLMNAPFLIGRLQSSRLVRRIVFAFGNPVCCPSITYVRANIPNGMPFDSRYNNSCDYKALVELMRRRGSFVYCREKLMGHRIHMGSATTKNIEENVRNQEDLMILSALWPKPIAKAIMSVYRIAEKSNRNV